MEDSPAGTARRRTILRLKRIGGQVDGIVRMIEEDRHCVDVLTQISAVQGALSNVSIEVLEHHVQRWAAPALAAENPAGRQAAIDELLELLSRAAVLLR